MGLGPLVETKRLEIQIEQLEAKLAKAEAERDALRWKVADLMDQTAFERARAERYLALLEPIPGWLVKVDLDADYATFRTTAKAWKEITRTVREARRG